MKWTENDIEVLKKEFKNGSKHTALILNRSVSSVIHKAHILNLKVSKDIISEICSLNGSKYRGLKKSYRVDDLTKNINEYTSYIFGLIWSDGYVHFGRSNVSISMIREDLLDIDHIFKKTGNWYIQDRNRKNRKPSRTMNGYNPNFTDSLLDLDFKEKSYKSPYKIFNIIPDVYKKYFIRGIIDGDGCFYIGKNGCYQMSIASTYDQDWSLYLDFFKNLDLDFRVVKKISKTGKSSAIRLTSKKSIMVLVKWLYDDYLDNNIGLSRKYNKSLLYL